MKSEKKAHLMNPKKLVLFALLVFVVLLISCDNETVVNNEKSENSIVDDFETPEDKQDIAQIKDSLPEGLDFGGTVISIITRSEGIPADDANYEFYAESETGDIVNDAIYRRNKTVEDRLNVNLNVIQGPGWQSYSQALTLIRSSVKAGDQAYDIVAGWSAQISPLAVEGLFANLHEMPYLDLGKPWWNQTIVNDLTVAKKLPFIAGDINLTILGNSIVVYYNNKIPEEYGLTENIYDVVFDGKWTIDYIAETAKNVQKDLNGDGVMDEFDQYGAAWPVVNYNDAFMNSSAIKIIVIGGDNVPVLSTDTERLAGLVDKVFNFLYNSPGVYAIVRWELEDVMDVAMFNNNQALMVPGYLCFAYTHYRETEFDYSILPYPKYDETQEYQTPVQNGLSLLCVPYNSDKKETIGAFMEAAACESYKNVSPVYFDTAMKVKYARDEVSAKMLDIIRRGINLNFASIYDPNIGSPVLLMREMAGYGPLKGNNFASWWEKNEPRISKALEKLVEKMQDN